MPTVLRIGPYRFFFYSAERDDCLAKYWLDPVRLQRSSGFGRAEVHKIRGIIEDNEERLVRSWNEYFGD